MFAQNIAQSIRPRDEAAPAHSYHLDQLSAPRSWARRVYWPVNATWQEQLRQGRLREALATHLEATHPDVQVTRLLEDLSELRAQLRAKAWTRAQSLADRLTSDDTLPKLLPSLLPNLSAEVAQLTVSGKHLERGEAEEALILLETVQLPLLCAEAETQRGTALVFLGDAEAAVSAFERAITLDARHYRALTNLGNVALEQGRTDEAIPYYEAALRLNENFANAHHNLGVAYRRKGDVGKSVAAIRRAQRVSKQREREEARAVLKTFGGEQRGKYVKWLLYALAAAGVFLLLRAQGVI